MTQEMIDNARPIDEVMKDILANDSVGFKWFGAIGKDGCVFELGGSNVKKGFNGEDGLHIKAYIPKYEDGKPLVRSNGYVETAAGIDDWRLEVSGEPPCLLPEKFSLYSFLLSTDFRKFEWVIEKKLVPVKYDWQTKWKHSLDA